MGLVDRRKCTPREKRLRPAGIEAVLRLGKETSVEAQPWNMAGGLPQQLRRACITVVDGANGFLRQRYMAGFHARFTAAAVKHGPEFRRARGQV